VAASNSRAQNVAEWRAVGLGGLVRLAVDYQRDPVLGFMRVRDRYGPTAVFARPSKGLRLVRPMVVTTDPPLLRSLLTDPRFRNSSLTLSGPRGSAHRRLRNSIFRMHGEEHRRNRRLITPAMQKKNVEQLHDSMVAVVDGVLADFQRGQTRDLAVDMKDIARQVSAASLFGLDDLEESARMGRMVEDWLGDSFKLALRALPYDLPGSGFRLMLRKAEQLERIGLELIERRRQQGYAGSDLLTHLVQRRDQVGDLSESELLGHLHILFLAAHETTSHALSWTLLLLAQHPEIFERVCEEVRSQLGGETPHPSELGKLPLLERTIDESLRLFPIVPFGARIASTDVEIAGHQLARKTRVLIPFATLHHDPSVFPEPNRFQPDRWLSGEPPPYTYLPFSAGLHMCIGVPFAKQSMLITLAMLLRRYSLQLPNDLRVDRHTTITMSPSPGVPVRLLPPEQMPQRVRISGSACDLVDFGT
jgi:cytochrome P450